MVGILEDVVTLLPYGVSPFIFSFKVFEVKDDVRFFLFNFVLGLVNGVSVLLTYPFNSEQ